MQVGPPVVYLYPSPRTGMADPSPDRLRDLTDAAFESFVRRFAETVWPDWEVTVSPVSPDRSIDVRLSRDGERELLHVKRRPAGSPVGAPAVRDLAAIRDRRGLAGVTLAATGTITDPARTVATDRGVSVLDGGAVGRLCDELGVEIPTATADRSELQGVVETYAAYWPASLAERTREVLDAIDGFAAFDHDIQVGDASTVVDFLLDGRALVRARLGETNALVYVRTERGFESVVGLSAYRETQPPLAEVFGELKPRLEQASERLS